MCVCACVRACVCACFLGQLSDILVALCSINKINIITMAVKKVSDVDVCMFGPEL